MGSYKGAGPDGLKPIVMKNFGPIALRCISFIFKAIYSTGYIPLELRKSRVVFIPKPLKTDYGEAGSFRPISLTQYYFKTMERVVEWSLRENSDKYGKISKLQQAYCSTKGTDTALSTLVNMIESCILRSKICLVLSVDIKGAFNNLATKTIHKVLVDNKYPPIMIRWYMNFLKNRNSIAEVLGIIKTIRPVCGTPQGGVLSSRIWNLAFDPLLKLLNDNSPCSPVGFADDGALCFMGIDPNTMVANAQKHLNLAIEWGAQNGLSFCPKKTTVVFFTRKYNFHKKVLPKVNKIKMGGVEIKPSDNMTYLGIILDQKLNWSLHIKTKVSKAIKWLAVLKPAIDHIYGLSPSKMLWIYKQILLPRITYGAHVWGHSLTLEQQHTIKTLESLTFRYFAQIWKNTPTASLEVILNQKPAHLEVLSTAIKTFMRIKDQFQTNFWDGFPLGNRGCSHLKKLKQITSQIFLEDQSLDLFISDYRKNPMFNWNPPVRDLLQAACTNDVDDQVELDKFQLVESYTQTDQTTTNNTDIGQNEYTVDVTVRSLEHSSPVDGNVRVLPVQTLTDANTQTTSFDFDRIPDNVESDDSLSVENHSKHDNTTTDNDQDKYTVDVTVRSLGPITPVDGNIRVFSGLSLTDANTQTTSSGHSQNHPKHDNTTTDNDHDMYTVDVTVRSKGPITPVDGNIRVFSGLSLTDANTQTTSSGHFQNPDTDRGLLPVDGNVQVTGNKGVLLPAHVPKGAAKVVELTLELFDNNFNLYAKKINHHEDGLFIRAILMKNNIILFNNTFKINGTSNVAIATIASADQVCNQYLVHAGKGDSFICALGDGHHGVRNPIIRNEHLANFINTLNSIKVKIGLYTIVTGLKSDWLQYASHNTIYQELSLAPDKKKSSFQPLNHF